MHFVHAAICWARDRLTPVVALTALARWRHVAQMIAAITSHRAAFGLIVAALNHGVGIMAPDLIEPAVHRASVGGTIVVGITALEHLRLVAHVLTREAGDGAACALGVAALGHCHGIMAPHLLCAACKRLHCGIFRHLGLQGTGSLTLFGDRVRQSQTCGNQRHEDGQRHC